MIDLFQDRELWIAVLSGGVFVKIVDYLLPAFLNRQQRRIQTSANEKQDLRDDIDYLRGEIEKLRQEVSTLKESLDHEEQAVSSWQRRFWKKKLELEKVILQVKNFGDQSIQERVFDTLSEPETWGDEEW